MEKLELVAAGGISPVRTDPDLVHLVKCISQVKSQLDQSSEDSFPRKTKRIGTNFITKACVKTQHHGAVYDAGMSIGAEKSPYQTAYPKIRHTI